MTILPVPPARGVPDPRLRPAYWTFVFAVAGLVLAVVE